ncbi:MAG TPA: LPS export ABC transporter periplasmic protein LptC [Gemmatimonadaceae bacterium]|nr:LPS export ABC transporter periplasmic protein LptC [Gemmatimonadaceae bacterium]
MRRLVLLAAACVAATTAACGKGSKTPVVATPGIADSADQVLFHTRTVLANNGIQRAELFSDTTFVLDNQTRFDLRRVKLNFTKDNGAPNGTMVADHGVYNLNSRILEGWGDVVITLVDGRTLKSPHVIYNQPLNQLSSDTTYSLSNGDRTATGIGFNADPGFTHYQCLRQCGGSAIVTIPAR